MIAVALYGVTAGLALISACMLWLYAKYNRDTKGVKCLKGVRVSAICLAAIAVAQTALVVMSLW